MARTSPVELDAALDWYKSLVREDRIVNMELPLDQGVPDPHLRGMRLGSLTTLAKLGYGDEAIEARRQVVEDE